MVNGAATEPPAVNRPLLPIVPPPLTDHEKAGCGLRAWPSTSLAVAANCCVPPVATAALSGKTPICAIGPATATLTTAEVAELPAVSVASAVSE